MADFKKYLATEVLSEGRTISYRQLSRALKVHVNAAKCMLYEFNRLQNEKKPHSIYATYLLSGTKKHQKKPAINGTTNGHNLGYDEDEPIPSSPPPFTSSMLEPSQHGSQAEEDDATQIPVRTISLVREEGLDSMKEEYETISSIHVYSLSPARIQDLVTLTDTSRSVFADTFTKEDPLVHYKTYGVIQNPSVRRRKGKRPVIPSGPAPKFQPVKDEPKKSNSFFSSNATTKQSVSISETKKENDEATPSRPSSRDSTSTTSSAKQPTLKRDSSDLFKAFAKQSQQKPRSSMSRNDSQDQDSKMSDAPPEQDDEGESEDESLFLDTGTRKAGSKKRPSDVQKERDDRAAKLRKMMESDDEDETAVPDVEKASGLKDDQPAEAPKGTDADGPGGDAEDVAWSDSDTEKKSRDQQIPTGVEISGPQRRRGKRKVMKKRTTKDEDGYLVTKEEAVWESYSEDEPESKPLKSAASKAQVGKSQSSQTQGKSGRAGTKKAGGNIMSFFGKKA